MLDALFTLEYFPFAVTRRGTGNAVEGFERFCDNWLLYPGNR